MLLAIDCSFGGHSAAIYDGRAVVASVHHPRIHATRGLPDSIGIALGQAKTRLAQIEVLAVGIGPGLFSGIRAACATSQGIAYALQLPAALVPTTVAQAYAGKARRAFVAYPAHREHCYIAAHVLHSASWTDSLEAQVHHRTSLPCIQGDWELVLRRTALLPGRLAKCVAGKTTRLPVYSGTLAPAVARLGWQRWRDGQTVSPFDIQPQYVRHKVALTRAERLALQADA